MVALVPGSGPTPLSQYILYAADLHCKPCTQNINSSMKMAHTELLLATGKGQTSEDAESRPIEPVTISCDQL